MIEAITWENAHRHGDALTSMHRLRYRMFVERQGYEVPTYNGMEYDQFDTPAATYLVRRDDNGIVRACSRLIPTTRPYMIKELWTHLIGDWELPCSPQVWESTRITADDQLDAKTRERYFSELLAAGLEFGQAMGVTEYIGVMPVLILQRAIIRAGMDVEYINNPGKVGTFAVAPVRIHVTAASLAEIRRRRGLDGPVLNLDSVDVSGLKRAA